MQIRLANENDLEQCGEIYRTEFAKPPYNENIRPENSFKVIEFFFNNEVMYVAEEDNKILGFIIGTKYFWSNGWYVWVSEFFVHGNSQGKGVGKSLLDTFIAHFSDIKIESVCLNARKDAPAMNFYEKQGFERSQYVMMEKKLN